MCTTARIFGLGFRPRGHSQPHIRITLTLQAQTDIIMWRSFVLLLIAQPTKLSRSMESFRPHAPQYCFKYDASLTRIAVGIYTSDSDDLLTFAAVDLPFAVNNEAKRQNTMEFLAVNLVLANTEVGFLLQSSWRQHEFFGMGIQRQIKFKAGETRQHCIHYIVNAFRRKSSRYNTHTGQIKYHI